MVSRPPKIIRILKYIARRFQGLRYNYNLRRFYFNKKNIKIEKPIFVLGTQGAGLTLISRMIQRSPCMVYICGNASSWGFAEELHITHWIINENIPEELSLRSPGYKNVNNRMKFHKVFGYERAWLYATDEFLSEYRLTRKDATKELKNKFRNIIKKAIIAHAKNPKKARFLDKSQSFTLKITFIDELLSGCNPYFLLVTRNPYAMCYREVNKYTAKYKNYNKELSYEQNLRLAAEHWSNSYRCALEDGKKVKNFKVIKFEDLLEEPEKILKSICNFVKLDFKKDMLPQASQPFPFGVLSVDKWYPINPKVNESYLQKLSSREAEIIEEYCGDLIEKLGYTRRK